MTKKAPNLLEWLYSKIFFPLIRLKGIISLKILNWFRTPKCKKSLCIFLFFLFCIVLKKSFIYLSLILKFTKTYLLDLHCYSTILHSSFCVTAAAAVKALHPNFTASSEKLESNLWEKRLWTQISVMKTISNARKHLW